MNHQDFCFYKTRYRNFDGESFKITQRIIQPAHTFLLQRRNTNYPYKILFFGKAVEELFLMYEKLLNDYPGFIKDKRVLYNNPVKVPKKRRIRENDEYILQYREIVEPKEPLKRIQKHALILMRDVLSIKPHQASMAYEKDKSIVDNANYHKESNHFIRIDLENYFGSINVEFFISTIYKYYEFGYIQIYKYYLSEKNPFVVSRIEQELSDLLLQAQKIINIIADVAFLDNQLPQGSPLSPYLSNLAMMEIDYAIAEEINESELSDNLIRYSRYADDLVFSSYSSINNKQLQNFLRNILVATPLTINKSKSRYVKLPASVKVTGITISNEHDTTYGHKNKANLKRELFIALINIKRGSFDKKTSERIWGKLAYLAMIEPESYKKIRLHYAKKFNLTYEAFPSYLLNGKLDL
jgi:RNA-directed DNA polymerase